MAKYLDPKAGLTFKKVFAEHKELMISRAEGRAVEKIEIAKKLKSANQTISFISQVTGLSESEMDLL